MKYVKNKGLEFATTIVDDITKSKTKESVIKGLVEAFEQGYNEAIQVCINDGSKAGFDMQYALEDKKDEEVENNA
jgi:flagellar biosynthesis/type III secretory pathway protein FliH